ncbi:MAG: hypothetical protein LBI06_06515 [Treponema sp.]|jgi:hypothetical protein|nr:hypothetical protein [Treponema sp.]
MKKTLTIAAVALFAMLVLTTLSCGKLDVVGNDSMRAFGDLLQNSPQLVSQDNEGGGWSFTAPDNSARFIWSHSNAMLEFDAAPFIAAGLDPSKLPDAFSFRSGMLATGTKLGNGQSSPSGETTPLAAYQQIVKLNRSAIGYHSAMDHYGVYLGGGNLFEWAKNLTTNDKDIVFVLDPEPFIKAGVDPAKIEGWAFAKVPVEDKNGMMIVDKILKPFDL